MDNRTIADRLAARRHALEREHASLFRARAYRRAAETILGLESPVEELLAREGVKKLADLPGIGRGISRTIANLLSETPVG